MKIKEKYRFGFDYKALILFAVIMLPNIIWNFFSIKNDYLRIESVTPVVDIIGSIFQIIFVAMLCFIVPKEKSKNDTIFIACCCSVIFYLIAWIFYFSGIGHIITMIFALALAPCLAFILYEISIRNYLSIIPTAVFTICHLIFAIVNFVI